MEPSEQRYDMSAYILYQNQTIPEKWGSCLRRQAHSGIKSFPTTLGGQAAARPTTRPDTGSGAR